MNKLKIIIHKLRINLLKRVIPELSFIGEDSERVVWREITNQVYECKISLKSKLYPPYHLDYVSVNDFSYIARNSWVSRADIGKFCSIGMNFVCGRGLHPIHGISTSPYFYSQNKQNGASLSATNKVEEREWITIGSDVFIGMNVTVLDGVHIGDGAVVGAGAVVSKDIPPYAIAVGCPIKIIGYRFPPEIIEQLLYIKWWDKGEDTLKMVESMFFDVDKFIKKS